MLTPERREELEAIAYEIFDALSGERYEPSERGAGWAPTDKGHDDVIAILGRAKAKLWSDSPAEKRKEAIARAKEQAKRVAERLLGNGYFCHSCFVFPEENGKFEFMTDTNCCSCGKRCTGYRRAG